MTVVDISVEQTLALRQKILRPYLTVEQCRLPEDESSQACHFGAFQDDELVGVCSVYPQAFPNSYARKSSLEKSWHLRMMATEEHIRHQGFGKELIRAVGQHISKQEGELIWCNARASAISFYEVLGFKIEGDVFEVENIGPHLLMYKNLSQIKE